MKNPILAGVLNVIVPGAGMIYLKKWKDGLATFFIVPIIMLFGKSIIVYLCYPYLKDVESSSTFASALIISVKLVWWVALACQIWILFFMAYHEATGLKVNKNPTIAILLNFASAGLGFVYLKKWLLAIATFLWITFFIGLTTFAIVTVGEKDVISFWGRISILLPLSAYLYWDTSVTAYREAKDFNKGLETKTEDLKPQTWTPQSN